MITRRGTSRGYRSGHCAANATGGHARCRVNCGDVTCACWCHTVEWLAGSVYVDAQGVSWTCSGVGWYIQERVNG